MYAAVKIGSNLKQDDQGCFRTVLGLSSMEQPAIGRFGLSVVEPKR